MNWPYVAVGLWFIALGAWAAMRGFRARALTTLWPDKLSSSISRDRQPKLYWIGIGFYVLIVAVGGGFVLSGLAYLQTI